MTYTWKVVYFLPGNQWSGGNIRGAAFVEACPQADRVRHIEHGLGAVDSFDGTTITVTFDSHQTKSYHFNKSIQGGYFNFAA